MVLVLFLLGIIILFITLFVLISLSSFKINIKKLKTNVNLAQKANSNYDIQIGLYLFNKIPLIKVSLNKSKISKSKIIEKLKNYRQKQSLKIDLNTLKTIIKLLSLKIEQLNLYLEISTENAAFTAFTIALISSIISIILPNVADKHSYKQIKYNVQPIYNDKNQIIADLNSIIYVKMVHIISIIYIVLRKRSVDKNGRTSNRRAYAHSYE